MTPGRFRRRLSEDRGPAEQEHEPGEASEAPRGGWPALHALHALPWLSPRAPLRDLRLSCFKSYLPPGATAAAAATAGSGSSPPGGGGPGTSRPVTPKAPDRAPARGPPKGPTSRPRHKSNENVYYVTRPEQYKAVSSVGSVAAPSACLGARLRALSARCLALVHPERKGPAKSSAKGPPKRPGQHRPAKQRSFSSGALPGLQDARRPDDEEARAKSASLDRDAVAVATPSFNARRASSKSTSSTSEISEIFSRFQRRRVLTGVLESPAPAPPPLPPRAPARALQLVRLTRSASDEELGILIAQSDAAPHGFQVASVVTGGLASRDGQLRVRDELLLVNGRQLRGMSMAAAKQRLQQGPRQVDIVVARPVAKGGQNKCLRCGEEELSGDIDGPDGPDSGLDSSGDSHVCRTCGTLRDGTAADRVRLRLQAAVPVVRRALQESSVDYENVVLCPASRASPPVPPVPPEPEPETDSGPGRLRQQLFHKHKIAAARRSLAEADAESEARQTKHHSLKRRGARGRGAAGAADAAHRGTELLVELRKGPGCGALGFTVVGGADSPRGQLPIFVRSLLEGGQAKRDGRLRPGDELLSLNGQSLAGATHADAVAMFRAVRSGPVRLAVLRRNPKKAQSCSDLVQEPEPEPEVAQQA